MGVAHRGGNIDSGLGWHVAHVHPLSSGPLLPRAGTEASRKPLAISASFHLGHCTVMFKSKPIKMA